MSVINKMLKDLDKRGASPGGLERTAGDVVAPPQPAKGARGRHLAAWSAVVVVAIGVVSAALWLWPEPTNEQAKKGEPQRLAESKPAPAPQAPSAAVTAGETKPAESPPKPAVEPATKEPPATAALTASAPAPAAPAPAPAEPAASPSAPPAPAVAAASPPAAPPAPVAPAAPVAAARTAPPPSSGPAAVPPPPPPTEKAPKEAPKAAEAAPAAAPSPKPPLVVAQASPPSEPGKPLAKKEEPKIERRAPERKDGTITITKRPPAHAVATAEEKSSTKRSRKPAAEKAAAPAKRETRETPTSVAAAAPAANAGEDTTKGTISIERAESTRSDLATREFRSAVGLMNEGRIELALSGFANALRLDPKHVAARQAMIVLLMERGRTAETETVLRDGLRALPEHTPWAMLLARIQVQAGDTAGAADTLERALPYAKDSADYHGFFGTVLQMQSRHKDAIAHYEIAVRLSPSSGRYLTGLAMSLEEEKRVPEARDAYTRALATKSLGPDLQAFVERKLAQLQ